MHRPAPERDRHFTNPPRGGLHLSTDQLAHLKVLLDEAVPRQPGGPTDWEGAGRRYTETIIGYRAPCTCRDTAAAPGCPVHDPDGGCRVHLIGETSDDAQR